MTQHFAEGQRMTKKGIETYAATNTRSEPKFGGDENELELCCRSNEPHRDGHFGSIERTFVIHNPVYCAQPKTIIMKKDGDDPERPTVAPVAITTSDLGQSEIGTRESPIPQMTLLEDEITG